MEFRYFSKKKRRRLIQSKIKQASVFNLKNVSPNARFFQCFCIAFVGSIPKLSQKLGCGFSCMILWKIFLNSMCSLYSRGRSAHTNTQPVSPVLVDNSFYVQTSPEIRSVQNEEFRSASGRYKEYCNALYYPLFGRYRIGT